MPDNVAASLQQEQQQSSFLFQTSWNRLEMKLYELKKIGIKQE
jgi:hypothetical protein